MTSARNHQGRLINRKGEYHFGHSPRFTPYRKNPVMTFHNRRGHSQSETGTDPGWLCRHEGIKNLHQQPFRDIRAVVGDDELEIILFTL